MFEGYLIAKRDKYIEDGGTVFGNPSIMGVVPFTRCRDHSLRTPYNSALQSTDLEVFYIQIDEGDVATVRNDPDTYLMDINFEPVDLIPFANWLKAKGQTRGTFDPQVERYQQTRPEFVAAMQAVRDLL